MPWFPTGSAAGVDPGHDDGVQRLGASCQKPFFFLVLEESIAAGRLFDLFHFSRGLTPSDLTIDVLLKSVLSVPSWRLNATGAPQ